MNTHLTNSRKVRTGRAGLANTSFSHHTSYFPLSFVDMTTETFKYFNYLSILRSTIEYEGLKQTLTT